MSSQMPHGLRFSPFASAANKNAIMSAQQQPQQQTPAVPLRQQQRKSATPTNIPVSTPKVVMREVKSSQIIDKSFSDTDDDEHDYFEDDSDVNLSKEERYVLLQPRAEPQGQENLSGNVTPVNDNAQLNIYEKASPSQPATKIRYASASTDTTNPPQRFNNNRSVSVELRSHMDTNGNPRNSLIQHAQQQSLSNRNSIDHSNRSSLDVSQSSYSTLIIHDSNDAQPLFAAPTNKQDLYFINSSPSPPNYNKSKDKGSSRTLVNFSSHMHGNDGIPITENEQQYLNQSYVLKHLAKEVRLPNVIESTRDSGVSENTSHQINWSDDNGTGNNGRSKSKSQPDLTKLISDSVEGHEGSNSATNTLNFNDFEQLEVENNKLREQLNDCLMKVAKSQKLEQEVSNIYRVHEELVQSCERRERLERTARTRLQTDCRRLQELNRVLREQVEGLQQQILITTTQQQQQLASTGRTQQDLLLTQLIQQNKELVDANKRQYIEIQAQSATLEEQRIHINVLDSALKRLEEELRQKQLYQKQLQSLLSANERRDKLRLELENELSKDLNRTPTTETNLKWQLREKDSQIMRLEAECNKLEQRNMDEKHGRKISLDGSQDTERIISEAHSAQRKVDELQTRLKMVENRLAEKEKEDILRQLQEQKLYTGNTAYNLLNNTPSSSSIVSSSPTTPLIYNASNYENLMPSSSSSKTVSATSNSSFDALLAGAYSGLYQPNYGQKLSSVPPTSSSSGISPNTSCSSASTNMQHQHQQPSITSSSASNYLESLDEQRKTIDDQLKKLDNQLLTKICCFPGNLLSKKTTTVLSEEMATLTSSNNNSDAFLQNLAHLRNQRENTPANFSNSGKNEEISLLEKQGRSSQKLRSNLAQVSSTIGQNMNDISNIGSQSSDMSKLPKIIFPPRKDRQSSAPPSALPRPPRTLKPPRKIEYGRLSETDSNKSNSHKSEYEMKTSSLKRHQSPITSTGSKNFVDIKTELQMALNSTKNPPKNYGTIKNDTANNITKIYYSNKPDYLSTKNYQRLPDSPTSADSQKRFGFQTGSPKKITFMRQSPQIHNHQQSREGSISSGSNSRSSPKPEVAYQPLTQRSRTRTPPKYLNLNQASAGGKLNYLSNSNNGSPTKPTLPSSSVLHHAFQAHPLNTASATDWKQQHQRANSGRSNSGENKYRIQF